MLLSLTKGSGGGEGGGSMAGGGADWGEGTNRGASSAGRGTMLMGMGVGVGVGVGAGVFRGSCAAQFRLSACAWALGASAAVQGKYALKHRLPSDVMHYQGPCAPGWGVAEAEAEEERAVQDLLQRLVCLLVSAQASGSGWVDLSVREV